jgi:hypothetical protein
LHLRFQQQWANAQGGCIPLHWVAELVEFSLSRSVIRYAFLGADAEQHLQVRQMPDDSRK